MNGMAGLLLVLAGAPSARAGRHDEWPLAERACCAVCGVPRVAWW